MSDPKVVLSGNSTFAVLGVNRDYDSYANKIVRKLRSLGKTAYPVNPRYDRLFEQPVYESLEKCPSVPEVVVFVVNPTIGIGYLDDVHALGIKTIWLQPGTISIDLLQKAARLGIETIDACVLVVGNYL